MVIAVIGAQALYLLFIWLASAIVASYLSGREGFGERVGLASGLIVPVLSVIVWLIWPARAESDWKVVGPFGRNKVAEPVPLAERPSVGGEGAGAGGTAA